MDNTTVSAKTYDEAITKACIELQTTSEHLHVEILEKGTSGLFGVLGGKPCVIRARVMSEEEIEAAEKKEAEEAEKKRNEEAKAAEERKKAAEAEKKEETAKKAEEKKKEYHEKSAAEKPVRETAEKKAAETGVPASRKTDDRPKKEVSAEEAEKLEQKAEAFLKEIFDTMGTEVSLQTSFDHEDNELDVLLTGNDMGILIGKRGQTLDSLQYLVSLVVNKHHDGYIRIKLDTENYRERREEKLTSLAENIAGKVRRTRKSVSLEPMNPYERRIIHSALQNDPYVTTYSEGEDPYRHIVVVLKKDAK
jgi:spoIIIJ-associated protein